MALIFSDCVVGMTKSSRKRCNPISMHPLPVVGKTGRAFGNERVGNIGTIIDKYPSATAHGESVRSCTHICLFE